MTDQFQPEARIVISDLETLKVLSDPLRMQILELLTKEPGTVKQVAEKMGLSPHKLYYHVKMLEKHDLLRVVETRVVSGIIEKHFQVTAKEFEVDHDLLTFTTDEGKENIHALVKTVLDSTRDDLLRSLDARAVQLEQGAEPHPRHMMTKRETSRIPDSRAKEFNERLSELMREFEEEDDPDHGDAHPYALTIIMNPSFYYPDANEGQAGNDSNYE
ncbi:MAG: helix-turn-helix domain-containing protein [Chloroflexi bacterium]|nr:helix-turn-helix domain-containing protein [Chloroflexota bacterium]